jgi:bacillithiol biosynthesis deacetylase BshB1
MKLNIIAFGVHPDDVELCCSGVLMMEIKKGKKAGIIDLTRGEMGTRGTAETRKAESARASAIMEIHLRENLEMRDCFFKNDEAHQLLVIQKIRQYQPEVVFCNAVEDRHPDHARAAQLVKDSCFLSGLRKVQTHLDGMEQEAWRPKMVIHYIQDRYLHPDFVVDISSVYERKMQAVKAYETQFYNPDLNEPETYISSASFMDSIVYRNKMYGRMIGVDYAEGFMSEQMTGIRSLDDLVMPS